MPGAYRNYPTGPIKESPWSAGTCHCGKVAHYAVPKAHTNSAFDFYCADHKEQAYTEARRHHLSQSDRRQGWQERINEREFDEYRRDVGRHEHEPFQRGELSDNGRS